ncbi:MAG: hypothetical protein ACJ79S_20040, partial [Gemmatimonadaceae bacterium]
MSHLPAERLAALADGHAVDGGADRATPEEAAHLAGCELCTREREAHRRVVTLAAGERVRLAPPLTDWSALAAGLRAEGIIGDASAAATLSVAGSAGERPPRAAAALRAGRWRGASRQWGRIAAAAVLALGSAAVGRLSAGASLVPGVTAAVGGSAVASGIRDTARALGRLVADTTATFQNTTEALVALALAEQQYQRAASFLLEHDSTGRPSPAGGAVARLVADSSSVFRARLAALDNVMAASREALYEAPHDPVINRYYLAT